MRDYQRSSGGEAVPLMPLPKPHTKCYFVSRCRSSTPGLGVSTQTRSCLCNFTVSCRYRGVMLVACVPVSACQQHQKLPMSYRAMIFCPGVLQAAIAEPERSRINPEIDANSTCPGVLRQTGSRCGVPLQARHLDGLTRACCLYCCR